MKCVVKEDQTVDCKTVTHKFNKPNKMKKTMKLTLKLAALALVAAYGISCCGNAKKACGTACGESAAFISLASSGETIFSLSK